MNITFSQADEHSTKFETLIEFDQSAGLRALVLKYPGAQEVDNNTTCYIEDNGVNVVFSRHNGNIGREEALKINHIKVAEAKISEVKKHYSKEIDDLNNLGGNIKLLIRTGVFAPVIEELIKEQISDVGSEDKTANKRITALCELIDQSLFNRYEALRKGCVVLRKRVKAIEMKK